MAVLWVAWWVASSDFWTAALSVDEKVALWAASWVAARADLWVAEKAAASAALLGFETVDCSAD